MLARPRFTQGYAEVAVGLYSLEVHEVTVHVARLSAPDGSGEVASSEPRTWTLEPHRSTPGLFVDGGRVAFPLSGKDFDALGAGGLHLSLELTVDDGARTTLTYDIETTTERVTIWPT